jgi:hypothetical protein
MYYGNKLLMIIFTLVVFSDRLPASEPQNFNHVWEIGFIFGEIPFLSGSFKPGLTVGYHFNENLFLSATYQFRDYLQRDAESFNAQNIGFEGLSSSRETTGERMGVALNYRPVDWSPYIIVGYVWNNQDIETMEFTKMERQIGNNIYNSKIKIVQTRKSGFAPALGFGYRYDFNNGLSLNTNFAMGFFSGIPTPKVSIESSSEILSTDEKILKDIMDKAYKDNIHNHYHIFNLGIIYRFK